LRHQAKPRNITGLKQKKRIYGALLQFVTHYDRIKPKILQIV